MQLLLSAGLGLVAGVLSGLFGIGGGLIIVPGLILLGSFSQPMAAGTSLAALLAPVGALGAYQYWRAGEVAVWPAVLIAVGLLLGAYVGARVGLSLPPELVQRAFGVLLVLVGIRLALFA